MTIQAIKGGFLYPEIPPSYGNPPTFTNQLRFNASGGKVAMIFRIPKTGTLDQAEFFWAVTDTPHDVKISFQDVDMSTGNPDGSIDQYRVIPTVSVTPGWCIPGLITSDGTDSGTKRSVTIGDLLAVVWEFDSTTGDVRVATNIAYNSSSNISSGGIAYTSTFNGTSWTKANNGLQLALKYNDGTYSYIGPNNYPVKGIASNTTTFNNTSTPNYRGLYFSLPFICQCSGAWASISRGGDCEIDLIDSDGVTVIASASLDKDATAATLNCTFVRWASVTLAASTNYRLVVRPTSSTNISTYNIDVNSAAIMDAMSGGQAFQYTSAKDPTGTGDWTQVTTKRPWMGLFINGIDVSSGGGGQKGYAAA